MKNTTTKIIVIFVILLIGFLVYINWSNISNYVGNFYGSGTTKIFKVAGGDVGSYLSGESVVAEKDTYTKRDPKSGEVVIYQNTINGVSVDSIGEIVGIPESSYQGSYAATGYYLILKNNKIEVVPRDKIIWLVTRKAL
jgi:hypothetical protein